MNPIEINKRKVDLPSIKSFFDKIIQMFNKTEIQISDIELLEVEFRKAVDDYHLAQNHFDNVLGKEQIDIATEMLNNAKSKLDIVYRKIKLANNDNKSMVI